MRADNNWEDKIGKRLHDFEGELSPQAWNNISKKIQPKRRNRWFLWLPLILVFLSFPVALHYSGKLKSVLPGSEKPTENTSATPNSEPVKIAAQQQNGTTGAVAEKPEKVTDPVSENGTIQELIKEEPKQITEATTNKTVQKNEQIVLNPTIATTKKSKKKALVIIPGEGNKKVPVIAENSNHEKAGSTHAIRKGTLNSGVAFASRAAKRNAGKTSVKRATTSEVGASKTTKTIALNQGITGSEVSVNDKIHSAKITNKNFGSNENLKGNNSAEKSHKETAIQKENSSHGNTELKTEEIAKTNTSKSENSNQLLVVGDSLISKNDSLATKQIAKADSVNKKQEEKINRLAFSIYGTPHYTFQRVQPNETDDTKILRLNNKNAFELERFGYEFGLRGYYPLKQNLQLEFGLQLTKITQHLNFTTASQFADSAVVYQQGNVVNMQVYNRELKQLYLIKYTLGGLYAGLNTTLGNNLNLNGGIGANWILSSKTVPASTTISNASFAPYLNLGLQYNVPLSSSTLLQVGPNFQYYLKPLQQEQEIFNTKPTVIGIKVGLQFRSKP